MSLDPGRLKRIAKDVEEVLAKEFGARPGFVLVLTDPPDYLNANYVSNLERATAVGLLSQTATNMIAKSN